MSEFYIVPTHSDGSPTLNGDLGYADGPHNTKSDAQKSIKPYKSLTGLKNVAIIEVIVHD